VAKEKNQKKVKKEVEKHLVSTLQDGLKKVAELSDSRKRKFTESVDIAVNLGIDPKQSDQSVRGSVLLPQGSGKKIKAIVFTLDEAKKQDSINAGAILAGGEDLIAKVEGGFLDFDYCIATPDIMPKIGKVAKVLGPRGLMPSPKNGTVSQDVKKAVSDALKGKVSFKSDKAGIVHCLVGKVDFATENLLENISSVVKAIKDAKPEGAKGKYIKKFYISTTMGASVEVLSDSI
jgi:large subunit ribosomal protein L1